MERKREGARWTKNNKEQGWQKTRRRFLSVKRSVTKCHPLTQNRRRLQDETRTYINTKKEGRLGMITGHSDDEDVLNGW